MKTFSLKPADINRSWVVVDATEAPLGRLATAIATRLTGKYKPTFTPHVDDGDYVVVTNSSLQATKRKRRFTTVIVVSLVVLRRVR